MWIGMEVRPTIGAERSTHLIYKITNYPVHWPLCGSALDADDGSLLEADPHFRLLAIFSVLNLGFA